MNVRRWGFRERVATRILTMRDGVLGESPRAR